MPRLPKLTPDISGNDSLDVKQQPHCPQFLPQGECADRGIALTDTVPSERVVRSVYGIQDISWISDRGLWQPVTQPVVGVPEAKRKITLTKLDIEEAAEMKGIPQRVDCPGKPSRQGQSAAR